MALAVVDVVAQRHDEVDPGIVHQVLEHRGDVALVPAGVGAGLDADAVVAERREADVGGGAGLGKRAEPAVVGPTRRAELAPFAVDGLPPHAGVWHPGTAIDGDLVAIRGVRGRGP